MKQVLSIALLGALAAGPAWAAGAESQSGQSSYQSGQTSQTGQSTMGQSGGAAIDQQQSAAPSGAGMQADEATVREIQQKLRDRGYDVGEVDGIMGDNTRQALTRFQQDQGIQATGQLDQQTMAALEVQAGMATQQGAAPTGESGMGTTTPGATPGGGAGEGATGGMGGTTGGGMGGGAAGGGAGGGGR